MIALGFEVTKQTGSHIRYKHPDGCVCTVPFHGSKDLVRPLIRSILRDIELSTDDYVALLKEL